MNALLMPLQLRAILTIHDHRVVCNTPAAPTHHAPASILLCARLCVLISKVACSAAPQAPPSPDPHTVHNETTACDLQPTSQGEPRHRTSHRHTSPPLMPNGCSTSTRTTEPGTTVTLRVDAAAPPPCLLREVEEAARSGDLRSLLHPVDPAAHARSPWDELRVWDSGD